MDPSALKKQACEKALEFVQDGMVLGLGTGSTVQYFIEGVAARVKGGMNLKGVPTSRTTASLAEELKIPLVDPNDVKKIDLAVDGADEIDPNGFLVKGGGGALTREKILAYRCEKFVVVADETKRVEKLGAFGVPIEVLPFGWKFAQRALEERGGKAVCREGYVTDNQHLILDWKGAPLEDPVSMEQQLNSIVGVVENGLFTRHKATIIIAGEKGISVLEK